MANSLVVIVVVVGIAAGLGAAHGMLVGRSFTQPAIEPQEAPRPASSTAAVTSVREIKPVVVNLAAPSGAWARLEAALVFDPADMSHADAIVAEITNDFLAYVRTLTAGQLEGPVGLQLLREELEERAILRSKGRVREVAIETLVIQ